MDEKTYHRLYYLKNKIKLKKRSKEYYKQNKEKWKGYFQSQSPERKSKWDKNRLNEIRYSGNWFKVLERDNYTCQIQVCGRYEPRPKDKIQKYLVVHHKDGNSTTGGDRSRVNNDLDNLITLCKSCHRKVHAGKVNLQI